MESNALIQNNQTVVKGSLSSVARARQITVAEAFTAAELVVLLDTSASMNATDAPGGVSRYRAATNQLAKLQAEHPGKVAVFSFSSSCVFCPTGVASFLGHATDLATALTTVHRADALGLKFVVISDGEPDDEQAAMAAAQKFTSQISTVYVGPEGGAGAAFLAKLAQRSKGQSRNVTNDGLGLLAENCARLLAA